MPGVSWWRRLGGTLPIRVIADILMLANWGQVPSEMAVSGVLENGFDTVERPRCIEASTPVRAIAKAENSIPQRLEDVDKVGKSKVKAVKLDSAFVILAGASPTASVAAIRLRHGVRRAPVQHPSRRDNS